MELGVYTIYDSKAEAYQPPFCARNDATAIRWLLSMATDKTSDIGRHPADYGLIKLGTFDDSTGIFTIENQKHLMLASQLIEGAN